MWEQTNQTNGRNHGEAKIEVAWGFKPRKLGIWPANLGNEEGEDFRKVEITNKFGVTYTTTSQDCGGFSNQNGD